MPLTERKNLLSQLKGYFKELQSIPNPHLGTICGADMGSLFDRCIHLEGLGFGPFANEGDFNDFLRCGVGQGDELATFAESYFKGREYVKPKIKELVAIQDQKAHKICFTHGDAHSGNSLVRDGKVVALLDFEMSGFFPEH